MAETQTTYKPKLDYGRNGQIANTVPADVRTYRAEGSAGIPFGRVVSQGTDADQAVIGVPAPTRGAFLTQLSAALSDSATTVGVDDGNIVPVRSIIVVEDELMQVTAVSGNSLTVVRGYGSSDGAAHADNLPVFAVRSGPYVGGGFLGIAVKDPTEEEWDTTNAYRENSAMAVLSRGEMWIEVEDAVSVGDIVTVDAATGRLSAALPSFTSGAEQYQLNGRWQTSASADAVARLALYGNQV